MVEKHGFELKIWHFPFIHDCSSPVELGMLNNGLKQTHNLTHEFKFQEFSGELFL